MNAQMAERESFYAKARFEVECTTLSDSAVVERIVEYIK